MIKWTLPEGRKPLTDADMVDMAIEQSKLYKAAKRDADMAALTHRLADTAIEQSELYQAAKRDAEEAEAYAAELEAKLAKAMEVVEMLASADVDAVLGQAVDISCEILGELMEDEDDE